MVKLHFSLDELRVPITAVLLYGVVESLAERTGACSPTHAELVQMLPLRSVRQIQRLLRLLRRLKLIEWKRTGRANCYLVLKPDLRHVADVMRRERP